MLLGIVWLIGVCIACYLLSVVCDRYFVVSLDEIAKKRKLSDDVSGATLMAVGSSAPEFFTSLIALFNGAKIWLGAGTIIGSAIFNILIIIWGSALFLRAILDKKILTRDSLFYAASILLILVSFWDGKVLLRETIAFLWLYVGYIFYLVKYGNAYTAKETDEMIHTVQEEVEEIEDDLGKSFFLFGWIDQVIAATFSFCTHKKHPKKNQYGWMFTISLVWIIVLSWLLVESGVLMAQTFGIPEVIIWLTILAAGTSVPDLLSSVIVAKQWRGDMAVTNALGSNIFDICVCLWFPWFIYALLNGSVPISTEGLGTSVILLFGVLFLVVGTFVVTRFRINKYVWWFFIALYLAYLGRAIWTSIS